MSTVHPPSDMEQKLEILSQSQRTSKTEIVSDVIEQSHEGEEQEKDSYELGIELFGYCGSADGSLSVTYKHKMKEKLHAQYHSD